MSKKMSKTKRFASCAVATILGLSSLGIGSVPALADTTVTGEGEMNYVDMSQYTQVLLPTASTMKFALDPQGLSTMSTDTVSTKDLVANAGKIVSNDAVTIANYSYYPLKAAVKLYVTDTGASTLVSNPADVDSDTTRKVCLTVTPSSAKTTVTTDAADASIITATAGYAAGGEEVAITGTAAASAKSMVYALSGADYNFKKATDADGKVTYSAERDTAGGYGAASFKIGGAINKNADWSTYIAAKSPKTLKLNAVFSYKSMTEEEYGYLTDATDGFVQAGTYNLIQDTAPEVKAASVKYDPAKGSALAISLGTGTNATTVTSLLFTKHTVKTKLADSTDVPVKDAVTTVKSGVTTNVTGTVLNIPAVAAIQTELAKVDETNATYFDPNTNEYLKFYYEDATYSYEVTYDLAVTFADKTTSDRIPVTMIKYQAPEVQYTAAALAKAATSTASKAIAASSFTVKMGNGGATAITKVALNKAKTTAEVEAVDDSKVTFPGGNTIAIAASAFKYKSGAEETQIVYTVTFDSGETADVVIPVAK